MDFAVAYHRWILDLVRPWLGNDLVEVGAGTGSFSEMLLQEKPDSLTLVEPSEMFEQLNAKFGERPSATRIKLYQNKFDGVSEKIRDAGPPDTIIYINVLEHIEDDRTELAHIHRTLAPSGSIILFVPALQVLLSDFDKHIGHFRRYGKSELQGKLKAAGFRLVMLRWFDIVGILPWLIKYRILGSTQMQSGAVQLYDRVVVPVMRPFESLIHPPVGKNLIAVAVRD
ncbi:MAG TPA: methyltransferase domain-containing protein [Pyrinomonadaceae bacterium]|nr:methyltransferase domain-containing protein [Pyrinomonadaceae bacterium]